MKKDLKVSIYAIGKLLGVEIVPEYRFCERRWRVDYAIVSHKIAIEIEGGLWIRGRHVRGSGYANDCEKYNRLTTMGWRLLRYTYSMDDGLLFRDLAILINGGES
jgi:hypothetical protein